MPISWVLVRVWVQGQPEIRQQISRGANLHRSLCYSLAQSDGQGQFKDHSEELHQHLSHPGSAQLSGSMRKTQQTTRFKASPSHRTNSWHNGLWKTHIFLCEHIKKRNSMQILHFANELTSRLILYFPSKTSTFERASWEKRRCISAAAVTST